MADGTAPGGAPVTAPDPGPGVGTASAAEAAAGLGAEIVRFTRMISAWKNRAKHEAGAADRVLLARLVIGGPRRATDLAADTFLDLSTVSRQVRSLVERGLVERRPDPEDRRGVAADARPRPGGPRSSTTGAQRDAELAGLLEPWPAEDRYQLIRLMARLNDDLVELHRRATAPAGLVGATAKTGRKKQMSTSAVPAGRGIPGRYPRRRL